MISFLARRIFAALPVMFLVSLIAFSLLYFAPGDPAAVIAGDMAQPADIAAIRETLGLNQPFHVRLGIFLWNTFRGDLGISIFSHKPVTALIAQRIEPTLSLAVLTIIISIV